MRIYFFVVLFIIGSCDQTSYKAQISDVGNTETLIHTDSLDFDAFDFRILLNDFGQFDTSFWYGERDCMSFDKGIKLINADYDSATSFQTHWNWIDSDSTFNLIIFPSKSYDNEVADIHFLKGMYTKFTTKRQIERKDNKPQFLKSQLINGRQFSFIAFTDSTRLNDSTLYNEVNLTAVTFLDSIQIDFNFNCFAKNCDKKADIFVRILKSVMIEKI